MPVPPIGHVGGITEDAITAPCHDVRSSGSHVQGTSRTDVRLGGLFGWNRLDVPEAVSPNFAAPPPVEQV